MEIKIEKSLVEKLQEVSLKLSSLERLIGFLMSSTDYEVIQEKIDKLMDQHIQINAQYQILKNQISEIVLSETNNPQAVWELDFNTCIATIR